MGGGAVEQKGPSWCACGDEARKPPGRCRMRIVIGMNRAGKRRDADERQRYLIIAYLADGARSAAVAQRLGCARTTVVRVALHFLPPYCPTVNRIERLWLDLHAVVTRNHRC